MKIFKAFDLTYLSAVWRMELAPLLWCVRHIPRLVVKASSGHYPLPFLIRDV